MKPHEADAAIKACLTGWARLVPQADRLAGKAINAAAAGDRDKAMKRALEADPLLNEADTLLTAATIIAQQQKANAAAER
jgi:hypothetical protein